MLAAEGSLLQPAAGDWMEQAAVTIPGPLTDRICALAVETGLWLIPEASTNEPRTGASTTPPWPSHRTAR
ncbi:hypothetical protein [Streptomyces sp. RKAG290]|uniref:hypothetical protein n=1 Tax=Streptomyces sp. RKAG290 TaxID=2888348 RepID=UPI002033A58D|nr:hypothetical protein [Streptomyces sp. RKAG290]MCM2416413.1 hypothetical protein [Streptomyces sp. RKAG290]